MKEGQRPGSLHRLEIIIIGIIIIPFFSGTVVIIVDDGIRCCDYRGIIDTARGVVVGVVRVGVVDPAGGEEIIAAEQWMGIVILKIR